MGGPGTSRRLARAAATPIAGAGRVDGAASTGPLTHLDRAACSEGAVVDADVGQAADGQRPVAPGGWKRVLIGFAVGLAAGAVIALVLPRDDGPRRTG